jgi:hypothetical protein
MKLAAFLNKATGIPRNILNYLRTSGNRRLYKQWMEQADLPPEAIPKEEVPVERLPRAYKRPFRVYVLYILLGAAVVVVFGGLILLIVYSC